MSSRVGSAAFALTAAALLAVASYPVGRLFGERAVSSWWSGTPTIGDHQYHAKEVHIGLLASSGCDLGSDEVKCQRLSLGGAFSAVKYGELGLVSLLVLALGGLGIASLRNSDRKKVFARIALVAAAVSAIVSIALLLMGPDLKTGKAESVPMAMVGGLGLFFLGTSLSIIAGVMTLLAQARPLQPGWAQQQPPLRASSRSLPYAPPSQPVDVLALLQDDALRPAALGPEPMMGRVASPGGMLPGPSGPLAPMASASPQPLFSGAPQLRPLYEVSSDHGGSDGFVRPSAPQLPMRGPTPLPVAAISQITGAAIPPPHGLPPPVHTKPPSIAPPMPRSSPPPRPGSPSSAPPPRPGSPSGPPPLARPIVPTPLPLPPAPSRPTPSGLTPGRPQATIVSTAVPPPRDVALPASFGAGLPVATPGSTLAGPPGLTLPRPETDPDSETADFEKSTMEHGRPNASPRPISVDTDQTPFATGDSTSPSVPFETATGDSQTFSTEIPTSNDPDDDGDDDDEQLETAARERVSAPMAAVAPPRVSDPVLTSAVAPPRPTPAQPVKPVGRASEPAKPLGRASEQVPAKPEPKVPISTAPSSLPPPKEKPSAVSGPSPACPQCEAPMAWVEEHLRFYCKSCRMYF